MACQNASKGPKQVAQENGSTDIVLPPAARQNRRKEGVGCSQNNAEETKSDWNNPVRLKHALLATIQLLGTPGQMPDLETLRSWNIGMAKAAKRYGLAKLARECELQYGGRNEPGYWDDFSHLENEILNFITAQGGETRVIPRLSELQKNGKGYLLRPIRNFGGIHAVAERMGLLGVNKQNRSIADLETPKVIPAYKKLPPEVKSEILACIQQFGVDGIMPHPRHFRQNGREEFLMQLYQYGSLRQIARGMGLKWWVY